MDEEMDKTTKMGGPAGSRDSLYEKADVDVDEWRDQPGRHRCVHGGFEGTECRLSFYLPPSERCEAGFFQMLLPIPGIETAAMNPPAATTLADSIPFAMESGAYVVQ